MTNGHYFQLLDNGTEVEFMHSTDTQYHLNATLRLYCKEGFNYSERSCQSNGTWSGSEPICKGNFSNIDFPLILSSLNVVERSLLL